MFANQNLLKSIFESFHLVSIQHLITKIIKNKLITSKLLNILSYDKIFKSMGRDKTILEGHEDSLKSLALLPDGTLLSADYSMLKFWNPVNGKCIGTVKEHIIIRCVILLPEWKLAISLSSGIKIRLAKDEYQCIRNINLEGCYDYFTLLLLNNRNLLCCVYKNTSTNFMVLDSSNDYLCIKDFQAHSKLTTQLANLSVSKFASVSYQDSINLWDIDNDYKLLKRLDGHTDWVNALCFCAKDNVLLSGSYDNTIRFWDVETYECLKILKTNYNGTSQIFLLPIRYFVFGTFYSRPFRDDSFAIYDMRSYKCVNTLEGHEGMVICFLLLKDKRLVSGSQDESVIIWD
jgi:WD40 repeat protein